MATPETPAPVPVIGDRSLFPDLAARAYLNHCAISPPSTPVIRAINEALQTYATVGTSAFPVYIAQRQRLRGKLAALIGAKSSDIGLVANTTTGVVDAALCIPWREGDRILCFEGEFPTNVTPWQRAAARCGGRVDLLPLAGFDDGSGDGLARVEAALRQGARLLAVSAVQFQTGLRMPIAALSALCRRYGAELFVDAIQAAGVVPLDGLAEQVDYLSAGSHKWLMGPEGCAFLYVNPARVTALRPEVAGWMSHEDAFSFLFEGRGHLRYDRPIRPAAGFVEGGAFNVLGLVGLEAALDLITALGVPAIYAHVQAWHDALEPGLRALGFQSARAPDPAARSGILSFDPPAGVDLKALAGALGQAGVAVATPDGRLRFGPHWPNSLAEVPLVEDAVASAIAGLSRST